MTALDFEAIREESARRCSAAGLRFSPHLPKSDTTRATPRPEREISHRLVALAKLCAYVSAPEQAVAEADIRAVIERHQLLDHLTPDEREMLDMPRADSNDTFGDSIGWRMENIWPLAWALGYENEPPIDGEMIDEELRPLLTEFVPLPPDEVAAALESYALRPAAEIVQLKDVFYCAHNAARSAQFGGPPDCVPEGFDPIAGGGVFHERRHALTWILSPGVEWDDTDLST